MEIIGRYVLTTYDLKTILQLCKMVFKFSFSTNDKTYFKFYIIETNLIINMDLLLVSLGYDYDNIHTVFYYFINRNYCFSKINYS
jgi:hypothetical protein